MMPEPWVQSLQRAQRALAFPKAVVSGVARAPIAPIAPIVPAGVFLLFGSLALIAFVLFLLQVTTGTIDPPLLQAQTTTRATGQSTDRTQLEQAQEQLQHLKFEREQLRNNLETNRISEAETLEQVEALADQVRASKHRQQLLGQHREELIENRERTTQDLRSLRSQRKATQARIEGNLVDIYRLTKLTASASLLNLRDHRAYFKDSRYLTLIMDGHREALAALQQLDEELQATQEVAQADVHELAQVLDSLAEEQAHLAESERVLRESLEKIRRNRKLSQDYLAELDRTVATVEATLLRLEQAPVTRTLEALPPPEQLRGSLPPPAQGVIIAQFGQQDPRYELKKHQRGIVISVTEASPVHAVTAGRVVHAGPFRGYQQLVVLEHGHGIFTVYGHLDGVTLEKDAWVEAETGLGQPAYQPADGSHQVYFEVRVNGTPENPLDWLRSNALTAPKF